MYTTFYVSGDYKARTLTGLLCKLKVLCNLTPIESIVKNNDGDYSIEQGHKVDIFEIAPRALLELHAAMQVKLGIHCLWVEIGEYTGCIMEWEYYKTHTKNRQYCSMYSQEELAEVLFQGVEVAPQNG